MSQQATTSESPDIAVVVVHFLRRWAGEGFHDGNGSVLQRPAKRMKFTPSAKKCRTYVKPNTEKVECLICCDALAEHRLIHKESKDGEENKCDQPICFECLKKSIANQIPKTNGGIKPKCPFCNNEICSVVTLDDKKTVTRLPAFQMPTVQQVMEAGIEQKLEFYYKKVENRVVDWKLATSSERKQKWLNQVRVRSVKRNPLRDMERLGCVGGCPSLTFVNRWCAHTDGAPNSNIVWNRLMQELEKRGHKMLVHIPTLYGGTKLPDPSTLL
jgi:hypothetical protein